MDILSGIRRLLLRKPYQDIYICVWGVWVCVCVCRVNTGLLMWWQPLWIPNIPHHIQTMLTIYHNFNISLVTWYPCVIHCGYCHGFQTPAIFFQSGWQLVTNSAFYLWQKSYQGLNAFRVGNLYRTPCLCTCLSGIFVSAGAKASDEILSLLWQKACQESHARGKGNLSGIPFLCDIDTCRKSKPAFMIETWSRILSPLWKKAC